MEAMTSHFLHWVKDALELPLSLLHWTTHPGERHGHVTQAQVARH